MGLIGPAALVASAGAAMAQTAVPEPPSESPVAAEPASTPGNPLSSLWWADGQTRDSQGLETLADGLRRAPGLISVAAPGNGTLLLGVQHGRARPGVAVNGILLPGTLPINLALPDLDALLVTPPSGLDAGPAGAAGAAALISRRPAQRLAGAGEAAAGAFGSRRALGRIDVPLGRGARLGIGGVLHHDLGWLFNSRTGERLNRGQRGGLMAALDLDPAPDLAVRIDGLYQRSEAGNLPSFACDPIDPTRCGGRFASTGRRSDNGAGNPGWGPISADLAGQALGQRADLTLVAAELAWTPPRASVRLTAGLTRQTDRLGLDLRDGRTAAGITRPTGLATGGYGLIARGTSEGRQIDLSAGFDVGALTLTLAAGLRSEDLARDQADTDAGVVLADRAIGQRRDIRHGAAAAHLALADDRLTLDAGVRLTDERLDLTVRDRRAGCAPCLLAAGADQQRQRFWTPEVALGWQQGAALIFARSARTARLPGWNLLARSTAELVALPAETGWHHEAGIKLAKADRLQLTASGFVARTTALASPLLGIDPLAMAVAAGQRQDLANAGFDVVVQAQPLAQLAVAGTLAMQRARWRGAVPAGAPSRPLFAPDVTASLSAAWTQVLAGAGANLVPRLTLDYRSAMAVAAGSVPGAPGGVAPAGWQVAGAVQLEIQGGGWLVSLECRNCLDRTLVDGAVAGLATLNPPRWWQIRFLRRF